MKVEIQKLEKYTYLNQCVLMKHKQVDSIFIILHTFESTYECFVLHSRSDAYAVAKIFEISKSSLEPFNGEITLSND